MRVNGRVAVAVAVTVAMCTALTAVGADTADDAPPPRAAITEWTRGAMRLERHDLPSVAPWQQGSYTLDMFQLQDVSDKPVAYGGVLNSLERVGVNGTGAGTRCHHRGVLSALAFALAAAPADVANSVDARRVWRDGDAAAPALQLTVANYTVTDALVMPLRFTIDGRSHHTTALGIVTPTGAALRVKHRPMFGLMFYLSVSTSLVAAGTTATGAPSEPTSWRHRFAVFYDMDHRLSLSRHTFAHVPSAPVVEVASDGQIVSSSLSSSPSSLLGGVASSLVLGVYNVRNSNPPSWLHQPRERWNRYWQRIELLTEQLREHSPDIIAFQVGDCRLAPCPSVWCSSPHTHSLSLIHTSTHIHTHPHTFTHIHTHTHTHTHLHVHVHTSAHPHVHMLDTRSMSSLVRCSWGWARQQEVRYDSSLGDEGQHGQISHLTELLPGYQYVYQPAAVYFHADTYPSHDEEGCAIFSKYPIIHSDFRVRPALLLFLSY